MYALSRITSYTCLRNYLLHVEAYVNNMRANEDLNIFSYAQPQPNPCTLIPHSAETNLLFVLLPSTWVVPSSSVKNSETHEIVDTDCGTSYGLRNQLRRNRCQGLYASKFKFPAIPFSVVPLYPFSPRPIHLVSPCPCLVPKLALSWSGQYQSDLPASPIQ